MLRRGRYNTASWSSRIQASGAIGTGWSRTSDLRSNCRSLALPAELRSQVLPPWLLLPRVAARHASEGRSATSLMALSPTQRQHGLTT